MAALLRQGARRIGGSVLQRTQAALTSPAVAEERRRLVPRRMYSTEEQASEELARTIQQKKEELYDLIALGEMNDRTSSWTNAWLIQYLSEEITPRPSDSFLQAVQKTRRVYSGIRRAGLITLSFLATDYFLYNNKVAPVMMMEEQKVAPVMMMEEQHEARAVDTISTDGRS